MRDGFKRKKKKIAVTFYRLFSAAVVCLTSSQNICCKDCCERNV